MAEDPICGMVVEPKTAEFWTVRGGQTYYFCGEVCKDKFEKEPAKYLKKKGFFTRFLEKITKANEEKFGGEAPTCHH